MEMECVAHDKQKKEVWHKWDGIYVELQQE